MEGYVVILPIRHIPHPATGIHLVHIYTKATKTQKTKNIRDFYTVLEGIINQPFGIAKNIRHIF